MSGTGGFDRQAQLAELAAAAVDLVLWLEKHEVFLGQVAQLQAIARRCARLRLDGFTQGDLDDLAFSFTPFVEQFKEWQPPLERDESGELREPGWLDGLLGRHRRVRGAAFALRVIGEY